MPVRTPLSRMIKFFRQGSSEGQELKGSECQECKEIFSYLKEENCEPRKIVQKAEQTLLKKTSDIQQLTQFQV